ncbi:histidine kinase [Bradyrhizobium sp. 2S1]|uniref:histidine kinase n=1 Tax=Bradyrhizobium sp. 2S1 TaxID=1404429 RepID=UPI0020053EC8|nr:histidine kinase [Bradyrhizobium sp. 2S1]MCK7669517.1 histidine kinase [Bradyrhizobium sp. 2S1]
MGSEIAKTEPDVPKLWTRLSLRARLLLPMAAMMIGALMFAGFALQTFSPEQFEQENAQGARSAQLVADALNAALAAAHNPQQTLNAFAGGLGTLSAIEFVPSGSRPHRTASDTDRGNVPAWFTALLQVPQLGSTHPVKIGPAHVGDIVFSPNLSAEISEKWVGFLAIVASGMALMQLAALSAYFTTGTALRPLAQLGAGLTRMRNGEYDAAIPLAGPPEIRNSCAEANQLAATLRRFSQDNRELLRKLVAVQDDERRELARELHDEMGPLLFAIRANATALAEAEGPPEPGSPAHGILSAAEALQQANRRVLEGLSPLYVTELGLVASVQALLRNAKSQAPGLSLQSQIDQRLNDLDGLLSQTAYRSSRAAPRDRGSCSSRASPPRRPSRQSAWSNELHNNRLPAH